MAWTYSDWRSQSGNKAKLTRLRLHIEEVSDKVSATVSSGTNSRDASPLNEYLAMLERNERRLEKLVPGEGGGGGLYGVRVVT